MKWSILQNLIQWKGAHFCLLRILIGTVIEYRNSYNHQEVLESQQSQKQNLWFFIQWEVYEHEICLWYITKPWKITECKQNLILSSLLWKTCIPTIVNAKGLKEALTQKYVNKQHQLVLKQRHREDLTRDRAAPVLGLCTCWTLSKIFCPL